MLNFTVGPVMSSREVCEIGGQQVPYFRTQEFSELMYENERLMIDFSKAPKNSKVIFMTNSSTGAMEAVVMNCFDKTDRVIVIDGGSFGHRFVELCEIHGVNHSVIRLDSGEALSKDKLYEYDGKDFTGLLVNIGETSTGVLYDAEMIGEFCRRNNLFYVCDCVSSFLADKYDMSSCSANVMITGSQKALACSPGVSIIVLEESAVERVKKRKVRSMYFDLALALKDMERGQTPFTPAVGILRQINARLRKIQAIGGVDVEISRVAAQALDFRSKIEGLPFALFSEYASNAVTALRTLNVDAYDVFMTLKEEYGIWVCPSGGKLRNEIIRVGHIGCLTYEDNTTLIDAFKDMHDKGKL